jgi:site-specific DNA-methyltransferase (adenine-specific)
MTEHLVRFADSRDLSFLPDASVHLALTSPPYVTTEFYEGQEFDYQGHLNLMHDVFSELWRVLVPDGRFALNIADIHTKYLHVDDGRLHKVPLAFDTFAVAQEIGYPQLTQFI